MSSELDKLIADIKRLIEDGDLNEGQRLAGQAVNRANESKDEFLRKGISAETDDAKQLADWFGDLAFIFHQINDSYTAAKCFYTATVFDRDWTPEEHARVAEVLWIGLVFQHAEDVLRETYKELVQFLQELDDLADLAVRKERWVVCLVLTTDIERVHRFLFTQLKLEPEEVQTRSINQKKYRRTAHCALQIGKYDLVRRSCHFILTEFSNSDDSEALGMLARSFYCTGDYDPAARYCKQAITHTKTEEERLLLFELLDSIQKSEVEGQGHLEASEAGTQGVEETIQKKRGAQNAGGNLEIGDQGRTVHENVEVLYQRSTLNQSVHPSVNDDPEDVSDSESDTARSDGLENECVTSEAEEDSGSDSDDSQKQWSSIYYRSLSATDQAKASFYEQSCCQYYTQRDNEETETNQTEMLQNGLQLSEAYLVQFEDKHPSVQNREPFYPEMKCEVSLKESLLKQPKVFKRGILQIESSHVAKCLPIESQDDGSAIEISGRSKANQAYNDDEVVVELLDSETDHNEERFGRVIGVLKRNRHKGIQHPVFICTMDDMESHLVRPMCKTVPKIHILNKQVTEKYKNEKRYKIEIYKYDEASGTLRADRDSVRDINPGDREKYVFLVVLITWSRQHVYPIGAIIDRLPYGDTIENGLTILNLQHQIPALYTENTVQRVESLCRRYPDEPSDTELQTRLDLTHLTTFTVDPAGSRDIDDALSIQKHDEGYKVGVHIADVSHFVKKGDTIDQEAGDRATTFYPGIRRPRHMIPEPLSTNICSLLPNKIRLTLSVFFYLGFNGKPIQMQGNNFEMKLSYIKSRQQFTYTEVQRIIEADENDNPYSKDVKQLFKLAKAIRGRRLGNAMYSMDMEEEDDIEGEQAPEAHYMVEEFMIMANKKVAEVLLRKYPQCVPLRCQKSPPQTDIENFTKKHGVYLNALLCLQDRLIGGYMTPSLDEAIQSQSGKEIIIGKKTWSLISRCDDRADRYMRTDAVHPLQYLAHSHWMSIQEHAMYRCSGSLKASHNGRHFSLSLATYTHFTSPIRRYCDLIVHRLLKALLMGKSSPYQKGDIENICAHMNARMSRAKQYQRDCKVLQQAVELKRHQKLVLCFIDDVSDKGLVFRAPSLPNIGQKDLPFSLLGVGIKPNLQMDTDGGYDTVTATWVMRLYNFYKQATNETDHGETLSVNPYQEMRFMPISKWCRILKSCIDKRMSDFKKYVKNTQIDHKNDGKMEVTTECKDIALIQPHTKFSMSFSHGQIVKFQMTSVTRKGVLTPCPMLYSMTDNVRVCLLHRNDPVLYLSQYTTEPTLEYYTSIKVYLQRWLPLIEMEAAIGAVSNEESCVMNDIVIKFKNKNNTGVFKLPDAECEVRNIDFSGMLSLNSEGNAVNDPSSSYDWLCLRCPVTDRSDQDQQTMRSVLEQDSYWVGHAQVTSVKRKDQEITVTFELHNKASPLPSLAGVGKKFQVEIMRKSEVDRRTESFLENLRSMPDTLAERIALKNKKFPIPALEKSRVEVTFDIMHDLVIPPGEDVKYPLPANNFKQQEAVDKALVSRFSLIQGPPGTGKTYTGIKLICLFDKINRLMSQKEGKGQKQVLFCGPSNKSVDLVARWMKNRLGEHLRPKFVRVYGRSIEAIDFPIPGRTFLTRKSTRNQKADDDLKEVALHHLIRNEGPNGNRYAKEINIMDKRFRKSEYAPQPPEVIREYVHKVREASIEEIRKYDVIICTTAVGSNPKVLEATNVYQVIVDEAGMCPEPQCLVPIIATKAEQVVLIGDHKQLRPIIMCKEAAELGLEQSLFERYVSAENNRFTMLVQQYRMHPELCKFPSNQFYRGMLLTERGRWCDPLRQNRNIWQRSRGSYPHVLVHVEGEEKVLTVSTEDGNEQSKSNTAEVEQVVRVFRYLINEGIPDAEINIMSQYNAQCSEIKKALAQENLTNFQVSTVVSSQGGEWDYVIFSTARSMPDYKIEKNPTKGWCKQNLGFITDQNQINVALTRARKGLVIIGNQKLLQCDEIWKKLVKRYSDTDSIKTPEQFPPRERTRQEKMGAAQQQSYRRYGVEMFNPGAATSYEGPIDVPQQKNIGQRYNRNRNARPQHRSQNTSRFRDRPQSLPQNRSQNRPQNMPNTRPTNNRL